MRSLNVRRRLLTVATVTAAAAALAGCGTNVNAQTQEWYDPTDASNSDVEASLEGMAVRGLIVVSDGADAAVLGTFVNTGFAADEVERISVAGAQAELDGSLVVQPGQAVRLGPPADTSATVSGAGVEPGTITEVEISFASAPSITLDTVVRAPERYYEDALP